jgi:hypothetical protein
MLSTLLASASSVASMGFEAASTALWTAFVCGTTQAGLTFALLFSKGAMAFAVSAGTEVAALVCCITFVIADRKSAKDIGGIAGTCTGSTRVGADGPPLPLPLVGSAPFALPPDFPLPAAAATSFTTGGDQPPRCGRTGSGTIGKSGANL